jgi:hypothetical protein
MNNKPSSIKERVLKEYPNVTYWLEGRQVMGWGNLILTTERLIFLNRIDMVEWQAEKAQQLFKEGNLDKIVDFSLGLHKKNFQIPLSSLAGCKMGMASYFPFPRICMRLLYSPGKKSQADTNFLFRIPILKGIFQLEIVLVWSWIRDVRTALARA